ncbi:hypothetical protein RvY_04094 [Ramazzottius varieornatus]|uniref:Uncharacterized protein n=1 Tax=Ramazzottius varieornatus TaxID=947166 RepID=A0A1D1UXD7_RAMVA|nr:hypothetical protein RvY_04094 [Ramazzottius varieornatus]
MNFEAGIYDDPNVLVNVRVHPNSMSGAEKSAIDDVIDRTLRPYCMGTADLQTTIFRLGSLYGTPNTGLPQLGGRI